MTGAPAKLAAVVADDIESQIIRSGWRTGSVIGTEAELAKRYNVSRSIIRETVGQLERRGIASTRRGNGGGLIVSAPAIEAAVSAIANYLEFAGVDLKEILQARSYLEIQAAGLAAQRINEADLAKLNQCARQLDSMTGRFEADYKTYISVRETIADATGNELIALFVRALDVPLFEITLLNASDLRGYYALMAQSGKVKRQLVRAITDGDIRGAQRLAQVDCELQMSGYQEIAAHQSRRAGIQRAAEPGTKLGHALALRLSQDIKVRALNPGHPLGSEPTLMAQHGVGRAVFREALRLLEAHSIVQTKRGSGGGVQVAAPNPAHTVEIAARYISYMRLSPAAMLEVREPLELGAVKLAARRISAEDRVKIEKCLEGSANPDGSGDMLPNTILVHLALCAAGNNSVLSLLIRIVLHSLGRAVPRRFSNQKRVFEWVTKSHRDIAQAIMNGEEGVAVRKMMAHLSFLGSWYAKVLR